MKKKGKLFLILNSISCSLFAADTSSSFFSTGFFPGIMSAVKNGLSSFKESALSFFSSSFSFIANKSSEIGALLVSFWNRSSVSFVEANKKAYQFLSTTGLDFAKTYWLEICGAVILLIGAIVLIKGFFYKPKYALSGVPENAVPIKKEVKPESFTKDKDKIDELKESSNIDNESNEINPLNVPHVETEEMGFVANSSDNLDKKEEAEYLDLSKDPNIDKEDLEFFRSLSRDFNKMNKN